MMGEQAHADRKMLSNWQKERMKEWEKKEEMQRKKRKRETKREKIAKEGPLYVSCVPSLKAIKGDSSSLARELDII